MKLQKRLVLLLCLGCWLGNAACLGPQVSERGTPPASGSESQNTVATPESETQDYIHGWTFPTTGAGAEGKSPALGKSEENRVRMMSSETDSYIRAWTFPTSSGEAGEKTADPSKSRQGQPIAPPVDDTEEYINGWTFE